MFQKIYFHQLLDKLLYWEEDKLFKKCIKEVGDKEQLKNIINISVIKTPKILK